MKKTIIIISVLLAAIIAAAIVFLPKQPEIETPGTQETPGAPETPGNIIERGGEIAVIERSGKVIVIGFGNEPWIVPRDPREVVNYETNYANNALLLYLTQDGVETLYYKTENDEIRIENVGLFDAAVSEDGNHFSYVYYDEDSSENTVMFYSNGETEEVYRSKNSTFTLISPNGKTVWWGTLNDNMDSTTYVKIGEDSVNIGMNIEEVYISDNAEFIYYKEEDSENYYVQKGADRQNRQFICRQNDNNFIRLCYNSDYTQAYYQEDLGDGKYRTYLIINGEKPRLISNYYAYIDAESNSGPAAPVKDLTKAVWTEVHRGEEKDVNKLFKLTGDYSSYQIADDAKSTIQTNSENVCYFRSNDNLYKVAPTTPDSEPILITDNVQNFFSSPDFNNLYITNGTEPDSYEFTESAKGLYSVNPEGGKTLISENYDCAAADNENLYYIDGGVIYEWDGENALQIGDFEERDEVIMGCFVYGYSLIITPDGSLVVYSPSGEVYVRMDGENFVNVEKYVK